MHLTILSRKIANLTDAQFRHEFQVIHAEQTESIAKNLGIIHEYEQGLALLLLDQPAIDQTSLFPIREAANYQAFARLTWPSVEVMQGSFTTGDYRRSAGAHIFAQPFQIFLTEPLGPHGTKGMAEVAGNTEGDTIRVIVPILPSQADGASHSFHFEELWEEHASFVYSTSVGYSRHRSLQIPPNRLARIFDQTQFDDRLVVGRGGYEEFKFGSREAAEVFFRKHSQKLRDSYSKIVDTSQLNVFIFDCETRFAAGQRGWWQVGAGFGVGAALRMKVLLGI